MNLTNNLSNFLDVGTVVVVVLVVEDIAEEDVVDHTLDQDLVRGLLIVSISF